MKYLIFILLTCAGLMAASERGVSFNPATKVVTQTDLSMTLSNATVTSKLHVGSSARIIGAITNDALQSHELVVAGGASQLGSVTSSGVFGAILQDGGGPTTGPSFSGVIITDQTNVHAGNITIDDTVNIGTSGSPGTIDLYSTNGTYIVTLTVNADGTFNVSTNTIFRGWVSFGGLTNVLERSGNDLLYTNGGGQVYITAVNGSGATASVGLTTGGSAVLTGSGGNTFLGADGVTYVVLNSAALSPNTPGNAPLSLGTDSSGGAFSNLWLRGTAEVVGAGAGTADYSRLALSHDGTNILLDSQSGGTITESGHFFFLSNGVEVASILNTGAWTLSGQTNQLTMSGNQLLLDGVAVGGSQLWTNDAGNVHVIGDTNLFFNTQVVDAADAVAFYFNSSNALTTAGANLLEVANNGVNRLSLAATDGMVLTGVGTGGQSSFLNIVGSDANYIASLNCGLFVGQSVSTPQLFVLDWSGTITGLPIFSYSEDGASTYPFKISPKATDAATPYILGSTIVHTSGNLLEVANDATNQFTANYAGQLVVGANTSFYDGALNSIRDVALGDADYNAISVEARNGGTETRQYFSTGGPSTGGFDSLIVSRNATNFWKVDSFVNAAGPYAELYIASTNGAGGVINWTDLIPTAPDGDTAYKLDTWNIHTFGNLLTVGNQATNVMQVTYNGALKTTDPSAPFVLSDPWQLGKQKSAVALTLVATNYVEVTIGGVTVKLATVQ